MSKKSLLAIVLLLMTKIVVGQLPLKWFDPANSSFAVIDGRGWQNELAYPYDRLSLKAEKMVSTALWNLSHNTAGCYINFKTSASTIVVRYKAKGNLAMPHMPATGVSGVDLYARDIDGNWQWARGTFSFGDTIEYRFSNLSLSSKEDEFRLYLPLYNTVSWMSIGVSAETSFNFIPISNELPIVAYGTSIMQGACATRPGLAWTNILGRNLDRSIINLGFSGNGQLEKPVIDLISEIDAQLYILDCMPNLVDSNKFSREEIQQRIFSSVHGLQGKHPETPVLLTEHCCGVPKTEMDTSLLKKYKWSSNVLAEAFAILKKDGVKNIYLLTDEAIGFNEENTVDGTHPNDIGMMKYAKAYEKIIREILKEEKGECSTTIPVRQRRDYATYDFMQRHNDVLKTVKEKQPEVVLIGNSITHFWGGLPESGINRGAISWKKYLDPLNTVNLGFGWDRIENVLWRVHHGELDGFSAKKIVLTIGTNNLAIGQTDEEITDGLDYLLKAIRSKQPSTKIYLSGIYPRRGMEARIELLNRKISKLALTTKVVFINPGVHLLNSDKKIHESLFSDGLHPNEKGYELLGMALKERLTNEKK